MAALLRHFNERNLPGNLLSTLGTVPRIHAAAASGREGAADMGTTLSLDSQMR